MPGLLAVRLDLVQLRSKNWKRMEKPEKMMEKLKKMMTKI